MKRSKGITIFSWLIIASSALGLLFIVPSLQVNPPISLFIYLIIYPTSIVTAIFLLKAKNWARLAIIIISIIVAAETLATFPYTMNKMKEQFDLETFKESIKRGIEERLKTGEYGSYRIDEAEIEEISKKASKAANMIMIIFVLISLGFNCGVIYFLTRTKVKEQFS